MTSEENISYGFSSYDDKIEHIRKVHFKRLNGITYLDHAGAALYSDLHLSNVFSDLSSNLYGNPHSRCQSSLQSSEIIEVVRNRVLSHFSVTSDEYAVIFTSNCTSALKIVGECFDFCDRPETEAEMFQYFIKNFDDENQNSCKPIFLLLNDNHTSVVGIRELVKRNGIEFRCIDETAVHESLTICRNSCLTDGDKITENYLISNNLFAFPAQSNFSGRRYPLSWIKEIKSLTDFVGCRGRWYVLLDAASFITTSKLDLSQCQPDFVTLSFYKLFGYPTGLGALLVKRSSCHLLRKTFFGGGTVEASLTSEDFHVKRQDISQRFEDGTLPFLEILAVKHGFDSLIHLAGSMDEIAAHTFTLAKHAYDQLTELHHDNGCPLVKTYQNSEFVSNVSQGPIINFNLLHPDGSYIGFSEVEKLSHVYNIHFRTGCFCNIGACQQHLTDLTADHIKANLKSGHVCGDDIDLIDGRPTGSIRISFGYCSTLSDVHIFVSFIRKCFLRKNVDRYLKTDLKDSNRTFNMTDHKEKKVILQMHCENSFKNVTDRMELMSIILYPVKSCGPFMVMKRRVSPRGLLNDREWMIVNDSGTCINQKRESRLCLIQPSIDENEKELILSYSGFENMRVALTSSSSTLSAQICRSRVCGDKILGNDCGEKVASWLQLVLNKPGLRLIRQNMADERMTNHNKIPDVMAASGKLSLANESQYLLLGSASLKLLLQLMKERVDKEDVTRDESCSDFDELVQRFRPNLVVNTRTPFEEETWSKVRIGTHIFMNEGPCRRCQMVCIDQRSGKRLKEPLLSLTTIANRKSTFGILLRYISSSSFEENCLSVGDRVVTS